MFMPEPRTCSLCGAALIGMRETRNASGVGSRPFVQPPETQRKVPFVKAPWFKADWLVRAPLRVDCARGICHRQPGASIPPDSGQQGVCMKLPLPAAWLASIAALATAGAIGLLAMNSNKAEAQGIMSAPTCQCSAPTSVFNTSGNSVVHCVCGGMSCVLSEHKEPGKNTNLMQCVR